MSKGKGPLSKLYNVVINSVDKFVPQFARPLWEADAGIIGKPQFKTLSTNCSHNLQDQKLFFSGLQWASGYVFIICFIICFYYMCMKVS